MEKEIKLTFIYDATHILLKTKEGIKKFNVPMTKCIIGDPLKKGEMTFIGRAICSPKDTYSLIKGRKKALTRAMIGFSRELRIEIWNQYKRIYKYR